MTFTTTFTAGMAAGLFSALLLGPAAAMAQAPIECQGEPTNVKLRVLIDNVRDSRGEMTATLYSDDPAKFLKARGQLSVWRTPAQAPRQEMCVWLPQPGSYAMAIYQDTNGNRRFDHGPFGPTEPYGFSRNPHLFFGPPSVGQVKFAAAEGETVVNIHMRNPGGF
jgi:uncharacterized protein (DUF2141 family)